MRTLVKSDWIGWNDINPSNVTCVCGNLYRVKFKISNINGELVKLIKGVCPSCNKGEVVKASIDPETFTIG